jgi:hypothetical protein
LEQFIQFLAEALLAVLETEQVQQELLAQMLLIQPHLAVVAQVEALVALHLKQHLVLAEMVALVDLV